MNTNTGSPPQRQYAVPQATARLVEQFGARCQNLGLLLDKFVPEEAIGESKLQAAWFKERLLPNQRQNAPLWEERYQRWLALTRAAGAVTFQAKLAWRMVVGLGERTVLETGLTLDHLTGLPIIPGSALKGLTRAYAVQEAFGSSSQKPENDPPAVRRIFGSQADERNHVEESAGTVIFFDALPVPPGAGPRLRFAVDIMNPHYPKYYEDPDHRTPPSNDQSPVPVYFLTVEGATFAFAVAPRSAEMSADAAKALEWLKEALQKYGVGGKTSAGYGAFKVEGAAASTERVPGMTEDDVLNWLGRKRSVTGTVEAQSRAGAILKLDDPTAQPDQQIPRGLLAGMSRPVGAKLTCRVMGVQQEQGEWFVKLGL